MATIRPIVNEKIINARLELQAFYHRKFSAYAVRHILDLYYDYLMIEADKKRSNEAMSLLDFTAYRNLHLFGLRLSNLSATETEDSLTS